MPTAKTAKPKARVSQRQRMEKAGPSAEQLRKLGKKRRPPQLWYEQTTNPFKRASK